MWLFITPWKAFLSSVSKWYRNKERRKERKRERNFACKRFAHCERVGVIDLVALTFGTFPCVSLSRTREFSIMEWCKLRVYVISLYMTNTQDRCEIQQRGIFHDSCCLARHNVENRLHSMKRSKIQFEFKVISFLERAAFAMRSVWELKSKTKKEEKTLWLPFTLPLSRSLP